MKWKVCGMKLPENILEVAQFQPDFMGFIFYRRSPRYVDPETIVESVDQLNPAISKVGLFVNENTDKILLIANMLQLDYAQLHGDESIEEVKRLKHYGLKVIKAFPISAALNWATIEDYLPFVDIVLFDTSGPKYGGNGQSFDWSLLNNYKDQTPFLIAGGIDQSSLKKINALNLSNLLGVDVNSKLECEPAIKDINKIREFEIEIKRQK